MEASSVTDPTKTRYVKSYAVRRAFRAEIQHPPAVPGVTGAIDIHCHAHEGQQDALDLAKHASRNGMGGILYKTIFGRHRPAESVRRVQDALARWGEDEQIAPIQSWAGWGVARGGELATVEEAREQLDDGVSAVWMPVANSANTLSKVGFGSDGPMPWEEALKKGHQVIDEHGQLKPVIRDIIHLLADRGAAMFFGHATHPEIWAMAEEVDKIRFERAVVDHPFSPFLDLTVEEMQQLAGVGIFLNFTYDEISPLLGVDPARMYEAIRAIGPEQVTLSSDAGEPLFPNSVECMRMMRAYMGAFGLTPEEVHQVSVANPAQILGTPIPT
jgi:hypothetical protein